MLKERLLGVFAGAPHDFEELALALFNFQYTNCAPYRRFCDVRGKRPGSISHWTEIPHLPVTAFKKARIYTGTGEPGHTFLTSGTTAGPEERGAHHFQELDLYRAAALPVFKRFILPDRERMPMLMLAMEPSQNPASSLSWYLQQQAEAFGAPTPGGWFVGPEGLQAERLVEALWQLSEPVALLGTAFAFVHLVDWMAERGLGLNLPQGSRVMETGGFKGKSRTVERAELYQMIQSAVGPVTCINQYGMTEMSSNCYDQRLVNGSPLKAGPDWVRIRMLHPETLQEVAPGQPGIVAVTDLANLYSCAFLLTQDLGIQHPEGFEVLGRAPGSEARGCSIAMDQFLAAQRG